jgi:homoserine O-succinyltransferase
MPVHLSSIHPTHDRPSATKWLCDQPSAEFREQSRRCITIGLINNMPDGALEATERQFLSLLNSVSEGISIHLSLYSLPGIPRNEFGSRHIQNYYTSVENLGDTHLDGLIVTGREPLTPNLADEPYWESFTRVLEWARNNTYSSVWSCLAAHAALLHMDGISRIKSDDKHCGVFECEQLSDHPLTAGTPPHFALPHSRWNGIPENALTNHGYRVLTRSKDVGVDTFVKQLKSLFVFFQGHPEYESNTLLLEYRRDIARYLRRETAKYPLMPQNYFDHDTKAVLTAFQEEAIARPHEELLAKVSAVLGAIEIENSWHTTAECIYKNWLDYICAQKELQLEHNNFAMEAHRGDSLAPILTTIGDTSVSCP